MSNCLKAGLEPRVSSHGVFGAPTSCGEASGEGVDDFKGSGSRQGFRNRIDEMLGAFRYKTSASAIVARFNRALERHAKNAKL